MDQPTSTSDTNGWPGSSSARRGEGPTPRPVRNGATPANGARRDQPPAGATVVCPYCASVAPLANKCATCGGRFDPLSRQATQNAMGPWCVYDAEVPSRPGCSYETLRDLIKVGRVRRDSIVRGPSTRQFWMLARRTPGVANLLGLCHACQRDVDADAYSCKACGAVFEPERDRQHLGLGPIRLLPGQASPERLSAGHDDAPIAPAHNAAEPLSPAVPSPTTPTESAADTRPDASFERRLRTARARAAQFRMLAVVLAVVTLLAVGALAAVLMRGGETANGAAGPVDQHHAESQAGSRANDAVSAASAESSQAETGEAPAASDAESEPVTETAVTADDWLVIRGRITDGIAEGTATSLDEAERLLDEAEQAGIVPEADAYLRERISDARDALLLQRLP